MRLEKTILKKNKLIENTVCMTHLKIALLIVQYPQTSTIL